MSNSYELRHRVALKNPYNSIDRVLEADSGSFLVGIKNIHSIPNTLMHKLEKTGFSLHTIDRKSPLAGRAVDTGLINPITGHWMSGSSSGTAVNVFAGINDLGIGNDGGGSVLAPAMCLNILGFISPLIEADRKQNRKANTDGIVAGNSIGFMARDKEILYKAIADSIAIYPAQETGKVVSDRKYDEFDSQVIRVMFNKAPRSELTEYLRKTLKEADVLAVTEGPVDLKGFGDSLFGHFDERTRQIQMDAEKGYLRVCNIAQATALCLPQKELGMATLLMCESRPDKIARLLALGRKISEVHDELIERYFLDLNNYFIEGYEI
ncbi:MAG: hypothetical protein II704_00615 [Erysipelotrichaceae bacterium]|nr:hypothetical protein [Erysipelotrichaceae bacterium]